MNFNDQKILSDYHDLHAKAVARAQPGTTITLHVRLDKNGHVDKRASYVAPMLRIPDRD